MACLFCDYSSCSQPAAANYLAKLSDQFIAYLVASKRYHYAINLAPPAPLGRAFTIVERVARMRVKRARVAPDALQTLFVAQFPALNAIRTDNCSKCPIEEYDNWFKAFVPKIIQRSGGPNGHGAWTLGNAQKFINVIIKYYWAQYFQTARNAGWNAAHPWIETLACCFHAPLDSIVLGNLHRKCRQLGISDDFLHKPPPKKSQLRSYNNWPDNPAGWKDYLQTQNLIRWLARQRVATAGRHPSRPWICPDGCPATCSYPACGDHLPAEVERDYAEKQDTTSDDKWNDSVPCPGALPLEADGLFVPPTKPIRVTTAVHAQL